MSELYKSPLTCRPRRKMAGMFRAGRSILRSVAGRFHQPQLMSAPRLLVPISFQDDRCFTTKGPLLSARIDLLRCIDEEIRMESAPALPHIGDFEVAFMSTNYSRRLTSIEQCSLCSPYPPLSCWVHPSLLMSPLMWRRRRYQGVWPHFVKHWTMEMSETISVHAPWIPGT